jgi:predicted nucleotidyltransferase
MTLDTEALAKALNDDPRVVLATLFGSARDGVIRPGSDVDVGVLLSPVLGPVEFFDFYVALTARCPAIPELDLVDLNHSGNVLAFEALSGRRLVVRDADAAAEFQSRVAREYEDDMLHASAVTAF